MDGSAGGPGRRGRAALAVDEEARLLDLGRAWRDLVRYCWVALLVPILAVVSTALLVSRQPETYASSASLLFSGSEASGPAAGRGLDPTPDRFLQTQAEVLSSAPLREAVAAEVGAAPAYEVTPVFDADILEVRAEATSPGLAAAVANAAVEVYLEHRAAEQRGELDAAVGQLRDEIRTLDAEIAELDSRISAEAPARTRVDSLSAQRGALVDARAQLRVALGRGDAPAPAAQLAAQVAALDAEIAAVDAQLDLAAPAAASLAALEQRRVALADARAELRGQLHEWQVGAALAAGEARALALAGPEEAPVSPRPLRSAVFAAVLGLLGGVALALLLGRSSRRVRSAQDLRDGLPGVAVLAELPRARRPGRRESAAAMAGGEDLHRLRASLTDRSTMRPPSRVQVTGSSPGAATGVLAARLAVAFADAGLRTLVVDGNLRRPRVAAALGLPPHPGVADVLRGEAQLAAAVLGARGRPLGALAAGQAGPAGRDLLGGERLAWLLAELAASCDVLVVDTAPVPESAEAAVMSVLVDATLVVATRGSTVRSVRESVAELDRVGGRVAGLVLIDEADLEATAAATQGGVAADAPACTSVDGTASDVDDGRGTPAPHGAGLAPLSSLARGNGGGAGSDGGLGG